MTFTLQYSTLNVSHHTPFAYVSILPRPSSHHATVSCYFSQYKKNITVPNFVYRGSQNHCATDQQRCCTVLILGKFHTQNAVDGCMIPVTKSQHLQSPYYQPGVPYTLSLTHSNPNPTTYSLCYQIVDEYKHLLSLYSHRM